MLMKNWKFERLTMMLIVLFSSALIVSCGPGVEEDADEGTATGELEEEIEEPAEELAEEVPEPEEEIELTIVSKGDAMDEIRFDVEEVTVPANALVTLTLVNESEGQGMNHNFVVIDPAHEDEVVQEGLQAGPENDFIPDHEGLIAASPLAEPGETVEFEFVSPAEPGEYLFICLYPGHVEAMRGTFIVEEAEL